MNAPLCERRLGADWAIPDPKDLPPTEYREVRNLIEIKVTALLTDLGQ